MSTFFKYAVFCLNYSVPIGFHVLYEIVMNLFIKVKFIYPLIFTKTHEADFLVLRFFVLIFAMTALAIS
jgi:hypothetical protein